MSDNVTISEMREQELPVNKVFRKEIGKNNDSQKITPINAVAMDVVTPIPIMVRAHITEIRGRIITEIIIVLQELFMEML